MIHFKVKNYEKLQHYKDRSPPWIKLYNSTLDDYHFGALEDKDKAHLFAIWLLASRNENKIPFDNQWVAGKINARSPVDLDLLVEKGFIIKIKDIKKGDNNLLAEVGQGAIPEGEGYSEEEEVEVEKNINKNQNLNFSVEEGFAEFAKAYPIMVDQQEAFVHYCNAILETDHDTIMEGLKHYIDNKPGTVVWLNPANWLSKKRWTGRYKKEEPEKPVENKISEHEVETILKSRTDLGSKIKLALFKKFGVSAYVCWIQELTFYDKPEDKIIMVEVKSKFVGDYVKLHYHNIIDQIAEEANLTVDYFVKKEAAR